MSASEQATKAAECPGWALHCRTAFDEIWPKPERRLAGPDRGEPTFSELKRHGQLPTAHRGPKGGPAPARNRTFTWTRDDRRCPVPDLPRSDTAAPHRMRSMPSSDGMLPVGWVPPRRAWVHQMFMRMPTTSLHSDEHQHSGRAEWFAARRSPRSKSPDRVRKERGVPPTVQQPVVARLTRAAIFLVATINPGAEHDAAVRSVCGDLAALVRAVGFRDLEGQLS